MYIEEIQSTENFIVFSVEFDEEKIVLQQSARIILNIFEEKLSKNQDGKVKQEYNKLLNMILKMPFKQSLKISELKPSKPYKFNFILENGKDTIQKNVFASTRMKEDLLLDIDEQFEDFAYNTKKTGKAKGLSESEDILYKATLAHDVNKQVFKNEKELLKKVMDARKSQNTSNYINESYKFCKPNSNKIERLKRTLMVAQGIELYENIYGYREGNDKRNGFQFGQNDWFMGPFYSYDMNSKALKENQIQKLTQENQQQQQHSLYTRNDQTFKSSQVNQKQSLRPQSQVSSSRNKDSKKELEKFKF